jgi:hypothetical protein
MMNKSYVYARKTGRTGTYVVELPWREAVQVVKAHPSKEIQIGIIGGKDLKSVKRVYGEFAPYYQVDDVATMLQKVK